MNFVAHADVDRTNWMFIEAKMSSVMVIADTGLTDTRHTQIYRIEIVSQ